MIYCCVEKVLDIKTRDTRGETEEGRHSGLCFGVFIVPVVPIVCFEVKAVADLKFPFTFTFYLLNLTFFISSLYCRSTIAIGRTQKIPVFKSSNERPKN